MSLQILFVVHTLPLWFLVFSLFLPRIALLVFWLESATLPFHLAGWIPVVFAIFLPRALVLYLIYMDQGVSLWFAIHLIVALVVWGSSSSYSARRRARQGYVRG